MTKRIAILGAGGFIGKNLIRVLDDSGHEVIAGVRSKRLLPDLDIQSIVSDFSKPEHFFPVLQNADILIHAASSSTVASSSVHPVLEFNSDLKTSLALIEALQNRNNIHVIFISSGGTIYGQQKPGHLITEDTVPFPKSYHGAAKLSVEYFLRAWAMQNSSALSIVRPSNIYGPGQVYRPGFGVIPALFESVINESMFKLRGSLETSRDFLFVDDFTDLIQRLIGTAMLSQPLTINAGQGKGTSLGELIQAVEKTCQVNLDIVKVPILNGEVDHIVLDVQKALNLLGWKPAYDLNSGLKATWDWRRK